MKFSIVSCHFKILGFLTGTFLLADQRKPTDDSLLVVQIKVGPSEEGMLIRVFVADKNSLIVMFFRKCPLSA